ncbi:HAMP domain-containing protein [Marinospirillum celere]|uniref:histidine kinase n=1 Tax=Marinospirillum celere TaxID=1122252 RepID=A0A1I1J8A4_9GAMM|nr:HAMP domain-containing sensor histidine kinase [Marinospirillum celere]SFC44341.1 HAMP domain-containing protein [Marinospirillum celere]
MTKRVQLNTSLAWRQTRWTLVAAILLGLVLSLLLIFVDLQQTRSNIETSTQELLRTTANPATQAAYTLDELLAEEVLEGLFAVQAVSSGQLVTERDRVLASRDRRADQQTPLLGSLLGSELAFSYPLVWHSQYTGEYQPVGELSLSINGGIAGSDFTRRVWWELVFGLVRNIILAVVILYISKHLLTQPLSQLVEQLRHRSRDDFTPLTPIQGHEKDEIGRVLIAFNELAVSLKQSTNEMERLNEIMAHHFQEPARRLVSYAQRLESRGLQKQDSDNQVSLSFIQQQALRLSLLVKDVQRYLALEQLKLEPEILYPGQVFQELVRSHSSNLEESQWSLEGEEVAAFFPPRRLREIFIQLLDNAFLYAKLDQTLQIRVRVFKETTRVRVYFEDNGVGIPPEYREQVFEIFSRLVPSTENYPGTGMGLALVKKMLLQFDGEINAIDSELGGVCFTFDLPGVGEKMDGSK